MNLLMATGNLIKDAELRTTNNGTQVLKATIIIKDIKRKEEDKPFFLSVNIWGNDRPGNRAEKLEPFLKKGKYIAVTGKLEIHEKDGKQYLSLVCAELELLSKRESDDNGF